MPSLIADRIIATLQIVGASATAVLLIQRLGQGGTSLPSLIIFVAMFALLVLSFIAGLWLWQREARGCRWTALSLALQVPVLQSVALTWKFAFGFGLVFFIAGEPGQINFVVGSSSQLFILTPGVSFLLGINLYALIALAYLLRRQSVEEREADSVLPQSVPARSGAFLYARDPARLADFYRGITGADIQHESRDRVVLKAGGLQFVIHEFPEGTENMPDTHGNTLKLFFTVASIDALREAILDCGGKLLEQRWPGPGFVTANVVDPDGNAFHLREPTS